MKIRIVQTPQVQTAVVLPVFKTMSLYALYHDFPGLEAVVKRYKFKCGAGETVAFNNLEKNQLMVLMGAGSAKQLRDTVKLAKGIISALKQHKAKDALIQFSPNIGLPVDFWRTLLDYLYISAYSFDGYRKPEDEAPAVTDLSIYYPYPRSELTPELITERSRVNQGVTTTRRLVNEPACRVTPDHLVDAFREAAQADGLSISIHRKQELQKKKLNGLLTVGEASPYEPALISIDYLPTAARPLQSAASKEKPIKTVALVGKGVTFDSGGLNIKSGAHMAPMKSDMAGAAAVLGIMKTAAALKLPIALQGYAAVAENVTGRSAFKPGDIILYKNKKSVEIVNTDAEGRLMLADALLESSQRKPDYIVELSTLSGSVANALGNCMAAVMGNHSALINGLLKAGKRSGEMLWQLPQPEEYKENIKSRIAHLKNAGYGGGSGMSAGIFLSQFVRGLPFAHIDIAGTAFLSKTNYYYNQPGATGFGVRLLVEFLQTLAAPRSFPVGAAPRLSNRDRAAVKNKK